MKNSNLYQSIENESNLWYLVRGKTGCSVYNPIKLLIGIFVSAVLPIFFLVSEISASDIIPYGNAAWIYDGTYDNSGKKGPLKPGLFASSLNSFNDNAGAGHEITQLFIYGGDVECPSSEEITSNPDVLNNSNSTYYNYYPKDFTSKPLTWDKYTQGNKVASSFSSSQIYAPGKQFPQKDGSYLVTDLSGIRKAVYKILVIDGDVSFGGYAQGLNKMTETQARAFADKVSIAVCSDQSIDGVQFDIEPFSFTGEGGALSGNGQKYFYQQIAKNFAGWFGREYSSAKGINSDLSSDPIHAVSIKHPNGRFLSIFASANKATQDVKDIYVRFGNFYFIVSLYDLDSTPGGQLTEPEKYKKLITSQIEKINDCSIPYQLAIPGAASVHEFESADGKPSGVKQLDYVKIVFEVIDSLEIRNNPNFKGIAIWSWNQAIWWKGHKFEPSSPPKDVISYLQKNL